MDSESKTIVVCVVMVIAIVYYLNDLLQRQGRPATHAKLKFWIGVAVVLGLAAAWTSTGK